LGARSVSSPGPDGRRLGASIVPHRKETIMNRKILGGIVVAAGMALAGSARASYHTFQISEIFSSADGRVQFVELLEVAPEDPYYGSSLGNGQNFWAGNKLTSSNGSTTNSFTFPANLPSSLTAQRYVLVATQSFAALGRITPDYVVPDN